MSDELSIERHPVFFNLKANSPEVMALFTAVRCTSAVHMRTYVQGYVRAEERHPSRRSTTAVL